MRQSRLSSVADMAILGITRIREKITYLIDLFSLAEKLVQSVSRATASSAIPSGIVYLLKDTFLRDLERNYFESVGFRVTLANNGAKRSIYLRSAESFRPSCL